MKVPKLKTPIWQEIIYLALTVVAPVVITSIELFNTHSSALKFSFASMGSLLVTFLVLRRFWLNEKIEKFREKIVLLEHDYSIKVGDSELEKTQWKRYNLYLWLYNAILAGLVLGVFTIFVNALIDQLISFKGAILMILIFVLAGMVFKTCTYLTFKSKPIETEDADNGQK